MLKSDLIARQRKTKDPCEGCALHKSLCICARMPLLNLPTRVSLVVHHRELKRTTNTGRLALRVLSNSAMYVRGRERLDLSCLLDEGYQPLLFYPSDDAVELSIEFIARISGAHSDAKALRPVHLIVPDGNWRQASKVAIRHPELAGVPRVMLKRESALPSSPEPSNSLKSLLRLETKPEGMATLEAIAHALRVIEGEEVFQALNGVYQAKLAATLAGRAGGVNKKRASL